MNEGLHARAREICAHLLVFPYVARDQYRDLVLDEELREEVERRLGLAGMTLAESFYSDWFAVRMAGDIEADLRFDWAVNQRLPKGALALLVVLWSKMVLPRRAAADRRIGPDEANLDLFEEPKPADWVVKIPREALLAEFAPRFGRSNVLRYLGTLKRYGFVKEDRANRLYEGPLLDLMVDGQRMATEVQMGALADLLGVDRADQEPMAGEPLFDLTRLEGEEL